MRTTRALAGIGVVGALFLTGGCGKAADKIAEKAAEKAVENAAGGGNLDITGDGFTFESEDGTISYQTDADGNIVMKGPDGEVITADADGNMTMSGEDGETTYSTGDNAELPDGWPGFLALPDGATIVTSTTTSDGGAKVGSITAEVDGDIPDLYAAFKEALEDEGFEVMSDNLTTGSSGDFASVSGEKGEKSVTISIGSGSEDRPFLSITVNGL